MDFDTKIQEAFSVLEPPILIVPKGESADGEEDEFIGNKWTEIADEVLEYNTFILICFTDEALVYYLPRYMSYAFMNPTSAVAESLVDRVLPPVGGEERPSFLGWWQLLSRSQRSLVSELVNLHVSSGGIINLSRLAAMNRAQNA